MFMSDETIKIIESHLLLHNLKWADLGKKLNVSNQVINNWKNRGIPALRLFKICEVLGLDINILIPNNKPDNNFPDKNSNWKYAKSLFNQLDDETQKNVISYLVFLTQTKSPKEHIKIANKTN